jgi:methylated-DNA-[protein]-cysteine S-methyltransferase
VAYPRQPSQAAPEARGHWGVVLDGPPPVGPVVVAGSDQGVCSVAFLRHERTRESLGPSRRKRTSAAVNPALDDRTGRSGELGLGEHMSWSVGLGFDERANRLGVDVVDSTRNGASPEVADPVSPALYAALCEAMRTGRSAGVPIATPGLGSFARAVLDALRAIPLGEVRTYRQIAAAVGAPRAARAVGRVLASNPVPLLVPCHRVVPTHGGLGGYAFGPELKEALLAWEAGVEPAAFRARMASRNRTIPATA